VSHEHRKPIEWVGSSLKDLREFPEEVKEVMGYALHLAQTGEKHPGARPLQGYHGAGVLEIIDDFDGDTYRAVYTIRLAGRVYVLHAFQKKSHRGRQTDPKDIELVNQRLRKAEELHAEWLEEKQ
jgi:phage-related protein